MNKNIPWNEATVQNAPLGQSQPVLYPTRRDRRARMSYRTTNQKNTRGRYNQVVPVFQILDAENGIKVFTGRFKRVYHKPRIKS